SLQPDQQGIHSCDLGCVIVAPVNARVPEKSSLSVDFVLLRSLARNKLLPDSVDTTMWEILVAALILAAGIVAYFERSFPSDTFAAKPKTKPWQEARLH